MALEKNLEKPIQKYRSIVQILFTLLVIWIGIEFYQFVSYLDSNGTLPYYQRPPGVDAFLPIGALMSIYYWILTGTIHHAHPAGMFILLAVITLSWVFGKSFCSWICPIGTLSEYIADFGDQVQKKLFKKIYQIPRWLDYPLRSLKYLIFGFFAYVIFTMSAAVLGEFLNSTYNMIADVKMYEFFADISRFSLIVIAVLFVLSIFIRGFWCRYLCPYGAFVGILSLLSFNKITRNTDTCTNCKKCAIVCPSRIKVDKVKTVISDECTTCMACVDVCPINDTLQLQNVITKKKVSKKIVAFGIVIIFLVITGIGVITGHWQNDVTKKEYLEYYQQLNQIDHPGQYVN
ncbi:Hypothetical iron-sulfur cluster binding protein YccM [hydrothermal vent metagenome]|uniref:Hypothetical iron-sulfur cluster binding protein YccM n=1 Tax=hydrothermal vent metagenome TaxID=652676 RepID=A0A3B1CDK6_9ZZZZ